MRSNSFACVTDSQSAIGRSTVVSKRRRSAGWRSPAGVSSPRSTPVSPSQNAAGGTVLDGTTSSDADGTIASYAWDFGDGETGTGATPDASFMFDCGL